MLDPKTRRFLKLCNLKTGSGSLSQAFSAYGIAVASLNIGTLIRTELHKRNRSSRRTVPDYSNRGVRFA